LVPELVQSEVTAERLAAEIEQLLTQSNTDLLADFTSLHQQLRQDADRLSADVVAKLGQLSTPSELQ
jgi:lipid-A-disaccharide synthase